MDIWHSGAPLGEKMQVLNTKAHAVSTILAIVIAVLSCATASATDLAAALAPVNLPTSCVFSRLDFEGPAFGEANHCAEGAVGTPEAVEKVKFDLRTLRAADTNLLQVVCPQILNENASVGMDLIHAVNLLYWSDGALHLMKTILGTYWDLSGNDVLPTVQKSRASVESALRGLLTSKRPGHEDWVRMLRASRITLIITEANLQNSKHASEDRRSLISNELQVAAEEVRQVLVRGGYVDVSLNCPETVMH